MSPATPPPSPTPLLTGTQRAEIHLLVVRLEEAMRKQQGHESEKSLFTSLVEQMKASNQPCLFQIMFCGSAGIFIKGLFLILLLILLIQGKVQCQGDPPES